MYTSLQLSGGQSSRHATNTLLRGTSPKTGSAALRRNSGGRGVKNQSPTSANKELLHSQAVIQRSQQMRLNTSGSRLNLAIDPEISALSPSMQSRTSQGQMCGQNSPTACFNFEDTMRDEVVTRLREQLETERKRHLETRRVLDDTMANLE